MELVKKCFSIINKANNYQKITKIKILSMHKIQEMNYKFKVLKITFNK